jgi:hypothetical protein
LLLVRQLGRRDPGRFILNKLLDSAERGILGFKAASSASIEVNTRIVALGVLFQPVNFAAFAQNEPILHEACMSR